MKRAWFMVIMALLLAVFPLAFCEDGLAPEAAEAEAYTPAEAAEAPVPEEALPEEIPVEPAPETEPARPEDEPDVPQPAEADPAQEPDPAPPETPEDEPDPVPETPAVPTPVRLPQLTLGRLSTVSFDAETAEAVLSLRITGAADILLQAEGLPVRVTLSAPDGSAPQTFIPDRESGTWLPLEAPLRLARGEYLVTVRKMDDGAEGACRLLLTEQAEPDAPASTEAAAEALPRETVEAPGEAEDTIVFPAESVEEVGETEAPGSAESAEALPEASVEAVIPEIPQSAEALPEGSAEATASPDGSEETAAGPSEDPEEEIELEPIACEEPEGIRVQVVSSLSGAEKPGVGTEVVLRAEVTGCDPAQVRILWQYSPDGGVNAVTVEGADGPEYRYTVDWENRHYLWRAAVILPEDPQPAE